MGPGNILHKPLTSDHQAAPGGARIVVNSTLPFSSHHATRACAFAHPPRPTPCPLPPAFALPSPHTCHAPANAYTHPAPHRLPHHPHRAARIHNYRPLHRRARARTRALPPLVALPHTWLAHTFQPSPTRCSGGRDAGDEPVVWWWSGGA